MGWDAFPPLNETFSLLPMSVIPKVVSLVQGGGSAPPNAGDSVLDNFQVGIAVFLGEFSQVGSQIRIVAVPHAVIAAVVEASQKLVEAGTSDAEGQAATILQMVIAAFLDRVEGQPLRDSRARVDDVADRNARAIVAYLAKGIVSEAVRVKPEKDAAAVLTMMVRNYLDRSANRDEGQGDAQSGSKMEVHEITRNSPPLELPVSLPARDTFRLNLDIPAAEKGLHHISPPDPTMTFNARRNTSPHAEDGPASTRARTDIGSDPAFRSLALMYEMLGLDPPTTISDAIVEHGKILLELQKLRQVRDAINSINFDRLLGHRRGYSYGK